MQTPRQPEAHKIKAGAEERPPFLFRVGDFLFSFATERQKSGKRRLLTDLKYDNVTR
jgi:hypothetical protein